MTEQHYRMAGYRPDITELPGKQAAPGAERRAVAAAPDQPSSTRVVIAAG